MATEKTKEPRLVIQYLVNQGCRLDARSKAGFTAGFTSI